MYMSYFSEQEVKSVDMWNLKLSLDCLSIKVGRDSCPEISVTTHPC